MGRKGLGGEGAGCLLPVLSAFPNIEGGT
jgi:hypothetical protein